MRLSDMYNIIKRPLLTEKSSKIESLGKYVFIVSKESNKTQIKKAAETIFNVKVKSVNIVNIHPKAKTFKGKKGTRPGFKKAVITTEGMKKIEFSKGI